MEVKSKENKIIIKALNMYGRVPEIYELLEEIENLKRINEEHKKLNGELRKENDALITVIDLAKNYIEEHIKYECDNAFNGMQFYSHHLYDFSKKELLEILERVNEE